MITVTTKKYDLAGNTLAKLIKIAAFGKVVPIGNLRGGPGLRCLLVLSLLHYGGYTMYLVNARYGHRLQKIKNLLRRFRP